MNNSTMKVYKPHPSLVLPHQHLLDWESWLPCATPGLKSGFWTSRHKQPPFRWKNNRHGKANKQLTCLKYVNMCKLDKKCVNLWNWIKMCIFIRCGIKVVDILHMWVRVDSPVLPQLLTCKWPLQTGCFHESGNLLSLQIASKVWKKEHVTL